MQDITDIKPFKLNEVLEETVDKIDAVWKDLLANELVEPSEAHDMIIQATGIISAIAIHTRAKIELPEDLEEHYKQGHDSALVSLDKTIAYYLSVLKEYKL